MSLQFPLTPNPAPKTAAEIAEILKNPGFGVYFTDHMSVATWKKDEGWVDDGLVPYGPFQIDPAGAVLHYGQEVFEGLKAYRHDDGSIWVFRAEENARRFNKSAARLVLPEIGEEDFLAALDRLVTQDAHWVPDGAGEHSLYLRPFMFAAENFLGVRAAETAIFCVIASPVGAYFSSGVKPVNLWVTAEYARAGAGGTGAAKCGGNYAASLYAQYQGYQHDCDQVLFIEALNKDRVEELGGMNLFVFKAGKLITPALTGTILDGITRKSIIQVAADLGIQTEERRITPQELFEGVKDGSIDEAFSCGTAAVITPVNSFKTERETYQLAQPSGEITIALRERLVDIQYGRIPDTHHWMRRVV